MAKGDPEECRICGDTEPFHVHVGKQEPGARRIENYFTIGRGLSEFESALQWQRKAKAWEELAHKFEEDGLAALQRVEELEAALRDVLSTLKATERALKGKGHDA